MTKERFPLSIAGLGLAIFLQHPVSALAAGPAASSEADFLGDLPVVLSVSRLAQPLDETPGAVTVIDREMIRRSGAREVTEVLRLVPGFITSHLESGARPIATYHADYDGITRHLQVFVDGRSVYSSLLVGTAITGLMGVVLDDVERIEVHRGSNSAAYGANAFLGVVNIVTRHAADARGKMIAASIGEGGVRDGTARIGWGDDRAAFRVTAASRRDAGFDAFNDDKRIEQVHFRGDLRPSPADELLVLAGHIRYGWGLDGPPRAESWRNSYASVQATRHLDNAAQLRLGALADEERYVEFVPFLSARGVSRRVELEAQHTFSAGRDWRFVWGGQYRREQVVSSDLFYDDPNQAFEVRRLFGNAEWKPHPQWVVNAGALREEHSQVGGTTSPRLMVNFHALPGHTLRIGKTTAYKQPTLFELRADWRVGTVPALAATGRVRAERIEAKELGYLGEFRSVNLIADVRIFEEEVRDLLRYWQFCGGCALDVINKDPNTQTGWEMQLRWQPISGTQILFNNMILSLDPHGDSTARVDRFRAPHRTSTLALFQRLPNGYDVSLIHSYTARYFYIRVADMIPAHRQTDVRLSRQFMIGNTRAEAALTVRAALGGHVDFVERGQPRMYLDRRAVASLRLEF